MNDTITLEYNGVSLDGFLSNMLVTLMNTSNKVIIQEPISRRKYEVRLSQEYTVEGGTHKVHIWLYFMDNNSSESMEVRYIRQKSLVTQTYCGMNNYAVEEEYKIHINSLKTNAFIQEFFMQFCKTSYAKSVLENNVKKLADTFFKL